MSYMLGRIVLGVYLGVLLWFMLTGVSQTLFEKNGHKRAWKIIALSMIWPLSLFSKSGRKTLIKNSNNL